MLVLGAVFIQGGSVVSGIGNSGNHFDITSSNAKQLGAELAEKEYLGVISDAGVEEIYTALVDKARQGDVDAAFVVLRVAKLKSLKVEDEPTQATENAGVGR